MNILHLEASTGWGGQEIRILREAEGMRQRGHGIVLAVMKGGELIRRAKEQGFIVYELNFRRPFWLFCLISLLWIMHKHKIDLVNTHSSLDSWIGGIAARIGKRAVVRTRHLSTPIKKGLNSRILYGKLADFIVTTCSGIIPTISEQSGKKLESCLSVPTGVNPGKIIYDPQDVLLFRQKLGVKPGQFLIGTACVMRSWKGVDDFLQAADLLRHDSRFKWVVIGGGHAERHKKKAEQLQLDSIVHFTGHLDLPFAAMAALDIFALLSTAHEGVSQAILQAAFLGKPLVATRVGGLAEVCLDRVNGLLVDPFSSAQVASAVKEIIDHEPLRKSFGEKAKELVLSQFTMTRTLDQMEMVYGRILHLENENKK